MRGVKISVPPDKFEEVKDLAFRLGIKSITTYKVEHISNNGDRSDKITIEIETNTPVAKRFTEQFIDAPFFDQENCFISTRQRRSIVSTQSLAELTWPWVEPGIDILQELWQFSHLTTSLIFRTLISGGLIAYGLINQQLLFIISGILFLPTLPIVLAMGFGSWLRQWRLVWTALITFTVTIVLLFVAGAAVGAVSHGPVLFDQFASLPVAMVVSVGVGVASALASSDDVGRREMIGLAATAQIAIIPVWIGACVVLGVPASSPEGELKLRVINFVVNLLLIIVASTAVYILLGAVSPSLAKLRS